MTWVKAYRVALGPFSDVVSPLLPLSALSSAALHELRCAGWGFLSRRFLYEDRAGATLVK